MESLSVAGVLISKTLLQWSKYTEGVASNTWPAWTLFV